MPYQQFCSEAVSLAPRSAADGFQVNEEGREGSWDNREGLDWQGSLEIQSKADFSPDSSLRLVASGSDSLQDEIAQPSNESSLPSEECQYSETGSQAAASSVSSEEPMSPLSNSDTEAAELAAHNLLPASATENEELGFHTDAHGNVEEDLLSDQELQSSNTSHSSQQHVPSDQLEAIAKGRRTVQWYLNHCHHPLYPSATISVLQACFVIAGIKLEGNMRDGQMDMMLRTIHEALLPKGNIFPPSLYLLSKILGCQDVVEYEWHCCQNGCHAWKPQHRENWNMEVCPRCGHDRFCQSTDSSGAITLKPYKVGSHSTKIQARGHSCNIVYGSSSTDHMLR